MGFMFNDITEYMLDKCHELRMREVDVFWKHVGVWVCVKNGKKKTR